MSLLNPDGYYFISSHEGPQSSPTCEWRDSAPFIYTQRNWDDAEYYYLEFKDGEAFRTTQLRHILSGFVKQLRDPNINVKLVLNNSHEAFLSVVEPIYRYVILGHNIPAEKIILMTGSFDMVEEVNRVAEYYGKDAVKVELVMDFETNARHAYDVLLEEGNWNPPVTQHDRAREKRFLNFNRRWRLHRPTLVMLMKQYGILDKGFVSLAKSDCGNDWNTMSEAILAMHQDFPDITYVAYHMRDELLKMPDLYLDEGDLVTNRADIVLTPEHNRLYEQSYFSVVSETHFYMSHKGYEPTRFLSEKAWKPILFKHPFIMVSTPHILPCLRQIGYQTFDGIIDESYDKIENDGDRLMAVTQEIHRLSVMSHDEIAKVTAECKEVCDHNFNVLINKTQFIHKLN